MFADVTCNRTSTRDKAFEIIRKKNAEIIIIMTDRLKLYGPADGGRL